VKRGIVFALAVGVLMLSGCASWWRSDTAKHVRRDAIDCTVEAVKANAAHLLPAITAILSGNAPNWRDQVGAFAKEFGVDATACALQHAAIDLQQSVAPAGAASEARTEEALAGAVIAKTYIDEQGWVFTQ
jgi:outer membrane murein-binding lipoprotein Lpp